MNRHLAGIATVSLAALVLAFSASAQETETKVLRKDLPAAIKKAADEQAKAGTITGYAKEIEDGKTFYEVSLKVNGKTRDVLMDTTGAVVEVEDEVVFDALPPAVRDGLKKAAGSGKIARVESITKRGTLVAYEGHVTTGKKKSEVQVGPDGKKLAKPE